MSTFTASMIESVANRLTKEARQLRNRADTESNERISMMLRRRSWGLVATSRKILEMLGS